MAFIFSTDQSNSRTLGEESQIGNLTTLPLVIRSFQLASGHESWGKKAISRAKIETF